MFFFCSYYHQEKTNLQFKEMSDDTILCHPTSGEQISFSEVQLIKADYDSKVEIGAYNGTLQQFVSNEWFGGKHDTKEEEEVKSNLYPSLSNKKVKEAKKQNSIASKNTTTSVNEEDEAWIKEYASKCKKDEDGIPIIESKFIDLSLKKDNDSDDSDSEIETISSKYIEKKPKKEGEIEVSSSDESSNDDESQDSSSEEEDEKKRPKKKKEGEKEEMEEAEENKAKSNVKYYRIANKQHQEMGHSGKVSIESTKVNKIATNSGAIKKPMITMKNITSHLHNNNNNASKEENDSSDSDNENESFLDRLNKTTKKAIIANKKHNETVKKNVIETKTKSMDQMTKEECEKHCNDDSSSENLMKKSSIKSALSSLMPFLKSNVNSSIESDFSEFKKELNFIVKSMVNHKTGELKSSSSNTPSSSLKFIDVSKLNTSSSIMKLSAATQMINTSYEEANQSHKRLVSKLLQSSSTSSTTSNKLIERTGIVSEGKSKEGKIVVKFLEALRKEKMFAFSTNVSETDNNSWYKMKSPSLHHAIRDLWKIVFKSGVFSSKAKFTAREAMNFCVKLDNLIQENTSEDMKSVVTDTRAKNARIGVEFAKYNEKIKGIVKTKVSSGNIFDELFEERNNNNDNDNKTIDGLFGSDSSNFAKLLRTRVESKSDDYSILVQSVIDTIFYPSAELKIKNPGRGVSVSDVEYDQAVLFTLFPVISFYEIAEINNVSKDLFGELSKDMEGITGEW